MPVRIGTIGVGIFGINHLRAFRQMEYAGKSELVCCAAATETRLKQRAEEFGIRGYTDYREMLSKEKLDAVSICTPDHLHRQMALDAFAAGLHVLVEKPLDTSVEGCLEIIEAGRKAGKFLQVDFHKRYDPYHQEAARLARLGEFGRLQYGYVHMEDKLEVPRDWFPGWAAQSSPAWFLGVHFYDLVRWIMRSNAVQVYATGKKGKLTSMGIDTCDSIQAKFEFENGVSVSFDTSWILPDAFEAVVNQTLRLVGTEGILEVDSQYRGARISSSAGGTRTLNMGYLRETVDPYGRTIYLGYGVESIANFVENLLYLEKGVSLEALEGLYPGGLDGLEATRMASAVHESIEKGVIVPIRR
ncbi:MAG: Gfo/Idh/MocA family oxidoreductase [Armatimonadetes bacterium]|nr:Gfo/Idh/MocA family oxidoreductase [Armatimonadota bacterium]